MTENKVILYDGDCGFCNFWVQWILKRDFQNHFKFASLQSEFGQNFLEGNHLPNKNFDTVYLVMSDKYFEKLNAVAQIGLILGGIYKVLGLIKLLPNLISDPIYMFISRNRKSFGFESCMLPTPEERKKFIM